MNFGYVRTKMLKRYPNVNIYLYIVELLLDLETQK